MRGRGSLLFTTLTQGATFRRRVTFGFFGRFPSRDHLRAPENSLENLLFSADEPGEVLSWALRRGLPSGRSLSGDVVGAGRSPAGPPSPSAARGRPSVRVHRFTGAQISSKWHVTSRYARQKRRATALLLDQKCVFQIPVQRCDCHVYDAAHRAICDGVASEVLIRLTQELVGDANIGAADVLACKRGPSNAKQSWNRTPTYGGTRDLGTLRSPVQSYVAAAFSPANSKVASAST